MARSTSALLCRAVLPASVAEANLKGARYGTTTRFAAGFDPKAHGAFLDPCCTAKDIDGACGWDGRADAQAAGAK
jgi:hypothetical protein